MTEDNTKRDWIHDRDHVYAKEHTLESIRLLRDMVLVKPEEVQSVSEGGIHLDAIEPDEQHRGVVLKTGPGIWKLGKVSSLDVQCDETVVFNSFNGWRMKVDGEELLVMRECDILGREV